MTLKLTTLTFENPTTGEKTEYPLPEGFIIEFKKPLPTDLDSATFIAGAILAGAVDSTKNLQV